ncbi:MAG TPA: hypothetical protein VJ385_21295 [Fibrobacteria bacterium]|nr:hypothetical protein [Fibrobacteria bacterium]
MPRRPETSFLNHFLLLLLLPAAALRAGEYNPDGSEAPPIRLSTIVEAGAAVAVGSDLGTQPQLGCFRDLPGSWQLGLQVRLDPADAIAGYDFLPQVNLGLRKLWLGDEDTEPIRNSEYFGLSLGGFFAYNFDGKEAGLKPFGTLSLGKYWMPFDNRPFGLDLNLELTRYLSGHLPGRSETTYVTLGLHLFYQLP